MKTKGTESALAARTIGFISLQATALSRHKREDLAVLAL